MIERAVYSLWTTPMEGQYVGFSTEEALIDCFKLSLYYTKQWFKEVHLVTDLKGKELVEKHGLEFDNINTDLEEVMKGVYENHWSLGKIYACKIQDKPFMHIDIDVIWFKKPPKNLLKADASFQMIETEPAFMFYSLQLDYANKYYFNKPVWVDFKDIKPYNCGFMGFNKLELLDEWWEESLRYIDFIDNSQFNYREKPHHLTCLIFEQFYIYHLCKHYKYDVDFLTNYHPSSKGTGWIPEDAAKELGFTHLISVTKRNPIVELKVKNRLKQIINLV